MRRLTLVGAVVALLAMALPGAAIAANPGAGTCSGGTMHAGTYRSFTVTGTCTIDYGANVQINGDLTSNWRCRCRASTSTYCWPINHWLYNDTSDRCASACGARPTYCSGRSRAAPGERSARRSGTCAAGDGATMGPLAIPLQRARNRRRR